MIPSPTIPFLLLELSCVRVVVFSAEGSHARAFPALECVHAYPSSHLHQTLYIKDGPGLRMTDSLMELPLMKASIA